LFFFHIEEDLSLINNQQPEKAPLQQQLKPSRCQTSSSSSVLMKGLNRSTTSNRVNLSSDVLKVKIKFDFFIFKLIIFSIFN